MANVGASLLARFNRIIAVAFVGVMLVGVALLSVEFSGRFDDECSLLRAELDALAVALDFMLKEHADAVDALALQADQILSQGPQPPPESALFDSFVAEPVDGYFTLDHPPAGYATARMANTTTPIQPIDDNFRLITELSFGLNDIFHVTARKNPYAAWIYFTAGMPLISIYPWIHSHEYRVSASTVAKEFYLGGLLERNPSRSRFWTAAYMDEAGKGLMVTMAKPVDYQGRFLGTVAIDLTLDEMRAFVARWGMRYGEWFVVNDHDQLLAHPRVIRADDREVRTIDFALPDSIRPLVHTLLADAGQPAPAPAAPAAMGDTGTTAASGETEAAVAAARQSVVAGGHLIDVVPLTHAPFRLVYLGSTWDIRWSALRGSLVAAMLLVAGLGTMVWITVHAIRQNFIHPTQQLVQYIEEESRGSAGEIPAVPPGWRPWFETIDTVFNAHAQLVSIRRELDVARTMQQSILPTRFPSRPDLQLGGRMLPAREVGGDFYDFFWLDRHRIGLVIADVSDKGVPAALFMAVARTLLRATAAGLDSPAACLAATNDHLAEDNEQMMFVTVFYGILETASGVLTYASGGHPPPVMLGPDGGIIALEASGGMALGVSPQVRYTDRRQRLDPGSTLILYTDGVTEALDPANNEFTDERLIQALDGGQDLAIDALISRVICAVQGFADSAPQADDLTVLALRYRGATPPA